MCIFSFPQLRGLFFSRRGKQEAASAYSCSKIEEMKKKKMSEKKSHVGLFGKYDKDTQKIKHTILFKFKLASLLCAREAKPQALAG